MSECAVEWVSGRPWQGVEGRGSICYLVLPVADVTVRASRVWCRSISTSIQPYGTMLARQPQLMATCLLCSTTARPKPLFPAQLSHCFTCRHADITRPPRDMPDVPDAVNTQSMHLHVGACVPHRQWVSGVVKLAILVQRHGYSEYY